MAAQLLKRSFSGTASRPGVSSIGVVNVGSSNFIGDNTTVCMCTVFMPWIAQNNRFDRTHRTKFSKLTALRFSVK